MFAAYARAVKTTRLRITMCDVVPTVVRIVDVPAASTLPELHDLLQAALGWTNSHLHQFVADDIRYGEPGEDDWDDQQDEAGVRLRDLPAHLTYLYDFGDGWEHDVEVLGPGAAEPGCVYGEGRCPPEDCGGPGGYTELLEVLADPMHEEHEHLSQWAGELAEFDQAATDLLVRRTVGAVPASVRLVLDLLADGVKLTPGGRLPRLIVRAVQQQRPHWYPLRRPASVEEDLYPLAVLHHLLRDVGLARLRNGVLRPTKAATDDLEIVRRLRSAFMPDAFETILSNVTIAVLVAGGPQTSERLAATVQPLVGHRWMIGGQPLTTADVRRCLYSIAAQLRALDLVEMDLGPWQAGPSAQSLLPGATALASIYAKTDHQPVG